MKARPTGHRRIVSRIVARYGVTIFYTAPTAIRAFMRWGTDWLKKHDLSSLRLLGLLGTDQPRGMGLVSPAHRR
jgi:acetyl-CoA synthetase